MLVKTYPVPSKRYGETVCCAAIDRTTGEWVRIYPVNFRALAPGVQFRKWQFVSATYSKARNDARPESIHIHQDSIQAGLWLPSKGPGWTQRRSFTDPLVVESVEALARRNADRGASLGVIRPRVIEDLVIEKADDTWDQTSEVDYQQLSLAWRSEGLPRTDLERLPYKFRYRFRCDDSACANAHTMVILDWEIGQAYRRWRREYGENGWRAKLREMYLERLPARDLHLILGTHHVYGNWMIVGVFAVPRPKVLEADRRSPRNRGREQTPMALPWVDLETQERNPL